MSLENALMEHGKIMQQLIEAMNNFMPPQPTPEQPVQKTKAVQPEKAELVKKEVLPAKSEPTTTTTKPLVYDQVAGKVLTVVKRKGQPAAEAILASFNINNLREAQPDQYADIVSACEQVLAEE